MPEVDLESYEVLEQAEQLLACRGRLEPALERQHLALVRLLAPLIGHQQHRLGDVE